MLPILSEWKLKAGGVGRVVPPLRCDGEFLKKETLYDRFREALAALALPTLTWYQGTRHTFASQWVLAGGSIEKLKEILGHFSITMTERYAHLRTDLFSAKDLETIEIDLRPGTAATIEKAPKTAAEVDQISLGRRI